MLDLRWRTAPEELRRRFEAPQITLTLKGILLNNKRYSYPTVIRTVCGGAPARREGRSGTPSRLPPQKGVALLIPTKEGEGILRDKINFALQNSDSPPSLEPTPSQDCKMGYRKRVNEPFESSL